MFGKHVVRDLINHSAETEGDRRLFLKAAGVTGLGTLGAVGASTLTAGSASAAGISDASILNFALNLEYLEAEYYLNAVHGRGLRDRDTNGKGESGGVIGGRKVDFTTKAIRQYAVEIAQDEEDHVRFLRAALGSAKVARPAIDIKRSFTIAARAAGLIGEYDTFNPYASEENFLLGAFIFEDVGVTAYKGAAPLISNKTYLEAAAGILAVEAYHAGIVRSALYEKGLFSQAKKISDARDALDGKGGDDQGIGGLKNSNLVPTDKNSIVFGRTPDKVLNIVYLNSRKRTRGGFFPRGLNGSINTSANSGGKAGANG